MSTAKGPGNFRDSWTQSGGAPINGFYFDAILHRTWPLTFVSGRICVKHFCNSNGHIQVLHGDRSVSAELVDRAKFINHVTGGQGQKSPPIPPSTQKFFRLQHLLLFKVVRPPVINLRKVNCKLAAGENFHKWCTKSPKSSLLGDFTVPL